MPSLRHAQKIITQLDMERGVCVLAPKYTPKVRRCKLTLD